MNQLFAIALAAAIVVLIAILVKLSGKKGKAERTASELKSKLDQSENLASQLAAKIAELETVNARLSKWQVVEDAAGKAREILSAAKAELDSANSQARQLLEKASSDAAQVVGAATTEASSVTSEARQKAKGLKEEAAKILDSATIQAGKIIDIANKKAEEIAGAAYDAMKNADQLEKTAKAMKHIVEGYGDKYLVPGHSMLDDLAEEFGFTEAGIELKNARERTKLMVRNGTAATCEYAETKRKDTATNFVLDAFNGKVDSILSRSKSDNAGKLEQEIRDAFTLVNHNGKAFREARVSPEYLTARIDELKWAAIVQQLKLEEREEQRRIREQIREEEKARRDYERAIREAAKEEDLLRKAMEKAQAKIVQATDDQKAKYEQQLVDLAERLRIAEEKNQRALSMAQQTKRGHVYIISNIGSFGEHVYKIGLTRRLEPLDRIKELGDSSVPFEFDVHAMIFSEDAPGLENQLHKHFVMMQMNKVNYRKEFFRVDLGHIREEVGKFGLTAKWTMAAAAQEYYESLAIEKAIKEDPARRDAWIKRQLVLEPVSYVVDDQIAENG
ncbi:MAG: DUF4041 domain-containing protein [Alphaproteobacteria bacterium]|nr:DUF4041 domain-containing protein [Alphaproteobacteria bacterium]